MRGESKLTLVSVEKKARGEAVDVVVDNAVFAGFERHAERPL